MPASLALWLARATDDARAPEVDNRREAAAGSTVPRPTLALLVAFVSGLTSLGYQVLWTRLLSSGTGGSTYVFTEILTIFLAGLAIGAILFAVVRRYVSDPVALLAASQIAVAVIAVMGLVRIIALPREIDASQPLQALDVLWNMAPWVVLPATIVMGIAFPASAALLEDRQGRVATATGQLLAANTIGAICGTFLLPFVVIPAIGSPLALVSLAMVNVATAVILAQARVAGRLMRVSLTSAAMATALVVVLTAMRPDVALDPIAARINAGGGTLVAQAEDEIAAVHAGHYGTTKHLWVGGTGMTLLTVDAKLMPVMPLIARPDSTSVLTVAFGMGSSFRTALVAGLEVDAVELVPSVPDMFGTFYPDASDVLANPRGRVIVADGRNHVELTDRRYDIIVTDPPPPIESSGVSVIASLEYYQAGHRLLNPGGIMMQWLPWGPTLNEYREHVRTFAQAFPEVTIVFGPGGFGCFMLGSDQPIAITAEGIRAALARPGLLEDISSAYDSGASTVDQWETRILDQVWLAGGASIREFAGPGPLITDDRPLPEYFLLRRVYGPPSPRIGPSQLRSMTGG